MTTQQMLSFKDGIIENFVKVAAQISIEWFANNRRIDKNI
jgi:hypothetical protein